MTHPYIEEKTVDRSSIGRPPRIDREFRLHAFVKDLAGALGRGVSRVSDCTNFAWGVIDMGDGLELRVSAMYGAKLGRVTVQASTDLARKLSQGDWPSMPSATYDTSRPLDKLSNAIITNIVKPARPVIAGIRVKVLKARAEAEAFEQMVAALQSQYPTGTFGGVNARTMTAEVYANTSSGYATGTLYADGRISFQRVSANTVEASNAVLRAVLGMSNE